MRLRRGAAALAAALAALLGGRGTAAGQSLADYDYENLQFRGLGAEVGWVIPTELEPTTSYGIRADLGFIGPRVRIIPSLRFWSSTLRREQLDRLSEQIVLLCEKQSTICPVLDLGQVRRSDLELSTEAHFIFPTGTALAVYAGSGLGLHLLNGRGELIDDTFVEDLLDTVAPGFNLILGGFVPLGQLQALVEARAVLTSDIQYANLSIGGAWTLPTPPPPAAPLRPVPPPR